MDRKTLIEVGLNIKRDLGIPKKVNIECTITFIYTHTYISILSISSIYSNIFFDIFSYRRILAWIRAHISIDYSQHEQ